MHQVSQGGSVSLNLTLVAFHNKKHCPGTREERDPKNQNNGEPHDSQLLPTNTASLLHILPQLTPTADPAFLFSTLNLAMVAKKKHMSLFSFLPQRCSWRPGMLFMGHDKIPSPESHRVTIQLSASASKTFGPLCFRHWALNALQGVVISNPLHKIIFIYL